MYYFGRCSSELAQLVPIPFFQGKSTGYSDRLHNFSSPFLYVTRMSVSTVSFLTQLGSGIMSIECFPLAYDLNGFKSRIK